jgi:hypothetical protein
MTGPHSHQADSNLNAVSIALFFVISLALSLISYRISWPVSIDWPWQLLTFCAPFLAAIWLGAFAGSPSPRQASLFGFVAGVGGFLLHLLVYRAYRGTLTPPFWPLSLSAFVLGGTLLCPVGCELGNKMKRARAHRGSHRALAPVPPAPGGKHSSSLLLKSLLGSLGPIIATIITAIINKWGH